MSTRPTTFKPRRSRIGVTRQAALDTLLARYAVPDGPVAPGSILEIGFGIGTSTLAMAMADPITPVVAADVHTPGVATLIMGLEEQGLDNVRVLVGDGRALLQERVAAGSLAGIRVYFPDPWPKARHRKRRLVDADFAALAADRLAPGGLLHCATDWEPYAEQMAAVLTAEPGLALSPDHARPAWRPITRYEQRGLNAGHRVNDFIAVRP